MEADMSKNQRRNKDSLSKTDDAWGINEWLFSLNAFKLYFKTGNKLYAYMYRCI